jgi:hypothetical protein
MIETPGAAILFCTLLESITDAEIKSSKTLPQQAEISSRHKDAFLQQQTLRLKPKSW